VLDSKNSTKGRKRVESVANERAKFCENWEIAIDLEEVGICRNRNRAHAASFEGKVLKRLSKRAPPH